MRLPVDRPYHNPMALTALLVSLIPLLTSLSMLALKHGVGPKAILYYFAMGSGFFLFGLVIVGSALAVVAMTRTGGRRDLRIHAAFASLVLAMILVALF